MQISHETEGDICVVTVKEDRIDAAVALAFKEAMRQVTDDAGERVVLNLKHVTFIDSSGLGALVATLKHLKPERVLILTEMTPMVKKVFDLTRMDSVFEMYPTQAEAMLELRV